jgi:arsenate reductase (glutaredoxin)
MSDEKLVIYHNPKCSKSRQTLEILQQHQLNPDIVEYLDSPPDREELQRIISLLGVSARELLRTTESAYHDANLDDNTLDENQIIEAICELPILLQRPIVVHGDRAVIGRPPEKVLEILA